MAAAFSTCLRSFSRTLRMLRSILSGVANTLGLHYLKSFCGSHHLVRGTDTSGCLCATTFGPLFSLITKSTCRVTQAGPYRH